MSDRSVRADDILTQLGELQRHEHDELAGLEHRIAELSAITPERQRALEDRLLRELGLAQPEAAAPRVSQLRMRPARVRAGSRSIGRFATFAAAAVAMLGLVRFGLWTSDRKFDVQYTLIAPPSDAQLRAPATQASEVAVFGLGRSLPFTLRPSTRYQHPVRVIGYAQPLDTAAAAHRFEPAVESDASGGLVIRVQTGPGSSLDIQPGRWRLTFYVSPISSPPLAADPPSAPACPLTARCPALAVRFVRHDQGT